MTRISLRQLQELLVEAAENGGGVLGDVDQGLDAGSGSGFTCRPAISLSILARRSAAERMTPLLAQLLFEVVDGDDDRLGAEQAVAGV